MTKKQKQQKKALRRRVSDIANGAAGYLFDQEDEFATASFLERFVPAIEVSFGFNESNHTYICKTHNLGHFNNIDSTTDFLWEQGVRA